MTSNTIKNLHGNWNYPTAIRFGVGRINELAQACVEKTIQSPLVVTDQGLATIDFVTKLLTDLQSQGLNAALFSNVKPNPCGQNIIDGVKTYQQGKHDGVICIGGGSGLDAGKAIALMVGQNRNIWDFEDVGDNWLRVNAAAIAPLIAVPTTAGTGSEVGRAAVIVDEQNHSKKIIFHPDMLPQLVIADPELTQGLPAHITAATGLDAFVHSLEAFCAPSFHPMADGISLEAMTIIKRWLPIAVADGNNLEARSHMLIASAMGATAFQKGLGAIHALAHPLGAIFDTHHGLLNAIIMPYVIKRNQCAIEEKICRLAKYLELDTASFSCFMDWIVEFRQALAIPNTLMDIGIDEQQAQLIGSLAFNDPSSAGNPIKLDAKSYSEIFRHAVTGSV